MGQEGVGRDRGVGRELGGGEIRELKVGDVIVSAMGIGLIIGRFIMARFIMARFIMAGFIIGFYSSMA